MLFQVIWRLVYSRYKLVLPPDGNWGSPMANGSFNGMLGMVQTKVKYYKLCMIKS